MFNLQIEGETNSETLRIPLVIVQSYAYDETRRYYYTLPNCCRLFCTLRNLGCSGL